MGCGCGKKNRPVIGRKNMANRSSKAAKTAATSSSTASSAKKRRSIAQKSRYSSVRTTTLKK